MSTTVTTAISSTPMHTSPRASAGRRERMPGPLVAYGVDVGWTVGCAVGSAVGCAVGSAEDPGVAAVRSMGVERAGSGR